MYRLCRRRLGARLFIARADIFWNEHFGHVRVHVHFGAIWHVFHNLVSAKYVYLVYGIVIDVRHFKNATVLIYLANINFLTAAAAARFAYSRH